MDYGHAQTDKKLKKLENRIHSEYQHAAREVRHKMNDYLAQFAENDKKMKADYLSGKITNKEYTDWRMKQMVISDKWKGMREDLLETYKHADEVTSGLITDHRFDVFALNHNYGVYEVEKDLKMATTFTLYDKNTVTRLIQDNPKLLPPIGKTASDKVKAGEAKKWTSRQLQGVMTQSVLQGDSVDKIAKRLATTVSERCSYSHVRAARTMTTSAENAGRMSSYREATKMGITMGKTWLAAHDSRTRHTHRLYDGTTLPIEEEFAPNLMFPADPDGDPAEVYNCRCTLVGTVMDVGGVDLTDITMGTDWMDLFDIDYPAWEVAKYKTHEVKQKIVELEQKKYSNIWKDDVTPADYAAKKDSIENKQLYFDEQIVKAQLNGWTAKEQKFLQLKEDLKQFEKDGKKYEALQAKLKNAPKESTKKVLSDGLSEARIANAQRFVNRHTADDFWRPALDKSWETMNEMERYGVWEYTHNSNPINKVLSGYANGSWDRRNFVGLGNAPWGTEDAWRSFGSRDFINKFGKNGMNELDYKRTIKDLTLGIEKNALKADAWFVRGSDKNGLAGMFEGDLFSFDQAKHILETGDTETLRTAFKGQTFTNHAYTSTGVASDAGFSGDVSYSIYAPRGTKAVYAEPTSFYGNTINMSEKLYEVGMDKYGVGGEAEMIFQRGTQFRVRDVEKDSWGDIKIELEVVGQPDYFKTGLEETFNNGATLHRF